MSWLTINGIELSGIVALDSPEGPRRDIGGAREAASGRSSLTRQARKRDLRFETVPLSGGDAFAWEALLTGAGHVWSFDVSRYSSKGVGPSFSDGTLESTSPAPKYGAKYLRLVVDATLEYALGAAFAAWTASMWVFNANAENAWTHYVVRSDGAKWVNGVRSDSYALSVNFTGSDGLFTVVGPDPGPANVDDLVICPGLWVDDWPAQIFAAGRAFGAAPYLTAAGLLVPEAATRQMLCARCDEQIMKVNLGTGDGLAADVRKLNVELRER